MDEVRKSNYAFAEEFKLRTKLFSIRVIKLFQSLPNRPDAQVIGKQLLRSATSVAANYRAACRGRSAAEFSAKIGIALEEADETQFWLEILEESEIMKAELLVNLKVEAAAITAILTSTRKSLRSQR